MWGNWNMRTWHCEPERRHFGAQAGFAFGFGKRQIKWYCETFCIQKLPATGLYHDMLELWMDYWRVKNGNITVFGHKNGTCFQETIFMQDAALWIWISCVLQIWIFDSKQSRVHLLLQSDTLKYGSKKRYLANLTLRKVIRIALKGWPSSQCCSEIGNYVGLVIWQKYSN